MWMSAQDIVRAGPDGCNLYEEDIYSLLRRAQIESIVKFGISVIFLIILIHASVSIDHYPDSINDTKIWIWASVVLVVLSEALVLISEANLLHRWNTWAVILVLIMLLI